MSSYRFDPFIHIRPSSLSEERISHFRDNAVALRSPSQNVSNASVKTSESSLDAQNEHNAAQHLVSSTTAGHECIGAETTWQAPKEWLSQPARAHQQSQPVSPEELEITRSGTQSPSRLEHDRADQSTPKDFGVTQSWRSGLNRWRVLSTCIFAIGNGMNDSGMSVSEGLLTMNKD